MYIWGRLRTASRPSRTLMLSAEYSPCEGVGRRSCGTVSNVHLWLTGSTKTLRRPARPLVWRFLPRVASRGWPPAWATAASPRNLAAEADRSACLRVPRRGVGVKAWKHIQDHEYTLLFNEAWTLRQTSPKGVGRGRCGRPKPGRSRPSDLVPGRPPSAPPLPRARRPSW